MKTIYSLFFLILLSSSILAQQYEGKINAVNTSGLHRILLSPEIRALSLNNSNHLRIYDENKNEVPFTHFIHNVSNINYESLPIVAKQLIPKVSTSIIIRNVHKVSLDKLLLKIANTEVSKNYNISGSNDSLQWFGLVNNGFINDLYEADKLNITKNFNFPLNDYTYLKFDFTDTNSLPINIIEAGMVSSVSYEEPSTILTDFKQNIFTDKKNKTTKIDIVFPSPQVIDGIIFDITTPNYFVRTTRILENKSRIRKNKHENYTETIGTFTLHSTTSNHFQFGTSLTSRLTIEIDNADNPELHINKIVFLQNPLNILTDIQANKDYTLRIDNTNSAPNYDLLASKINFNQDFPVATISAIKTIDLQVNNSINQQQNFWQTPKFMWICIVLAIFILAYFSLNMIRDVNKKE